MSNLSPKPSWVRKWTPDKAINFWSRASEKDPNDTKGLGAMYQRLLSHEEMKPAWESIKTKFGDDFDLYVGYICLICEDGFLGPTTTTEKLSNERVRNEHKENVTLLARRLADTIKGAPFDLQNSYIDTNNILREIRSPITESTLSDIYKNRITPSQVLYEIADHYSYYADAFDVVALHPNKVTVRRQYFVRTLKRGLETLLDDATDLDDVIVEFTRTALDDEEFTKTTMKNWKNE